MCTNVIVTAVRWPNVYAFLSEHAASSNWPSPVNYNVCICGAHIEQVELLLAQYAPSTVLRYIVGGNACLTYHNMVEGVPGPYPMRALLFYPAYCVLSAFCAAN